MIRELLVPGLVLLASCERTGSTVPSPDPHGASASAPASASLSASAAASDASMTQEGQLSADAAKVMADAFRSVGLSPSQGGNRVTVGGEMIEVTAQINDRVKQEGQLILAVEYHLSINSSPAAPLTAGVVSVDTTEEGIRKTAMSEWAAQYGVPIAYAIAEQLGGRKPASGDGGIESLDHSYVIDGLTLHTGPTGLRGRAKDPGIVSSDQFDGKISALVAPHLHGSGAFRSATVQLVIEGTRVVSGECRVGGVVSDALRAELAGLSWPEGAPTYMYKKYYVVAGARPGVAGSSSK